MLKKILIGVGILLGFVFLLTADYVVVQHLAGKSPLTIPSFFNFAAEGPGRTIQVNSGQSIVNAIKNAGSGGTVVVHTGDYPTQTISDQQFSSPVTVERADGENVSVAGFVFENTSGVTLQKMNVTTFGVRITKRSNNIKLDHLKIQPRDDAHDMGVAVDNKSTNIEVANCTIYGGFRGIGIGTGNDDNLDPTVWPDDINVHDNDISFAHEDNVHINGASHVIIHHNYIHDVQDPRSGGGAIHNDGVQVTSGDNIQITANTFTHPNGDTSADQGIILSDAAGADIAHRAISNVLIANNLVHHWTGSGITIAGGKNISVVNNTSYDNFASYDPTVGIGLLVGIGGGRIPENLRIWNNIFSRVNLANGATRQHIAFESNNLVMADRGGGGVNLVTADPQFADRSQSDPTHYQLKAGSPAINAGLASPETPTDDINGNRRVGAPDLGAIEYASIAGSPSATPTPTTRATITVTPTRTPSPTVVPGGTTIPPTIAADCSVDVTAAINAWISSQPDGATLYLGQGACYRIDGTLLLSNRNNLTLEGNGATFKAVTDGSEGVDKRTRMQFNIKRGSNITLRNLIVRGANPAAGTGESAYQAPYEAQHAFNIDGVQGALLDNVQAYDVYGDFVYIGSPGTTITRNITVKNSHFERNGRQGFSVTEGEDITFDHNYLSQLRRSTLDIEPNFTRSAVRRVKFTNNFVGPGRLLFFANQGAAAPIEDITISNNQLVDQEMNISARGAVSQHRMRYKVTDNVSNKSAGSPLKTVMGFAYIDGLEVSNNTQPVQAGRDMALVGISGASGVRVLNNKIQNATHSVRANGTENTDFCYSNNQIGAALQPETGDFDSCGSAVVPTPTPTPVPPTPTPTLDQGTMCRLFGLFCPPTPTISPTSTPTPTGPAPTLIITPAPTVTIPVPSPTSTPGVGQIFGNAFTAVGDAITSVWDIFFPPSDSQQTPHIEGTATTYPTNVTTRTGWTSVRVPAGALGGIAILPIPQTLSTYLAGTTSCYAYKVGGAPTGPTDYSSTVNNLGGVAVDAGIVPSTVRTVLAVSVSKSIGQDMYFLCDFVVRGIPMQGVSNQPHLDGTTPTYPRNVLTTTGWTGVRVPAGQTGGVTRITLPAQLQTFLSGTANCYAYKVGSAPISPTDYSSTVNNLGGISVNAGIIPSSAQANVIVSASTNVVVDLYYLCNFVVFGTPTQGQPQFAHLNNSVASFVPKITTTTGWTPLLVPAGSFGGATSLALPTGSKQFLSGTTSCYGYKVNSVPTASSDYSSTVNNLGGITVDAGIAPSTTRANLVIATSASAGVDIYYLCNFTVYGVAK